LHIPLQNMLERVWWCRCSKMESWNRTICCPMSCSNERKHARTRVVGDHMPPWSVMGKGRCYC
jgi:L,D-peptidoglycan transpeptidase YkuD (ErfK/YbiS/YcfS/YnhG family)